MRFMKRKDQLSAAFFPAEERRKGGGWLGGEGATEGVTRDET